MFGDNDISHNEEGAQHSHYPTLRSLDSTLYAFYGWLVIHLRRGAPLKRQILLLQQPDQHGFTTYGEDAILLIQLAEKYPLPVKNILFTDTSKETTQGAYIEHGELQKAKTILMELGYTMHIQYHHGPPTFQGGYDMEGLEGPKPNNRRKKKPAPNHNNAARKPQPAPVKKESEPQRRKEREVKPKFVPRISDELKFLRRCFKLHDKKVSRDILLAIINPLQKAILEQRIRSASPYVKLIKMVQGKLVGSFNHYKPGLVFKFAAPEYNELHKVVAREKTLLAVNFIRRYINLNAKTGTKEKARLLLDDLESAFSNQKLVPGIYKSEIEAIRKNLKRFVTTASIKTLSISTPELHGLEEMIGTDDEEEYEYDEY